MCLIFAGKILKDQETLKGHNLKDGLTIHLVIKSGNKPTQETQSNVSAAPSQQTTTPSRPPEATPSSFGIGGLGGLAGSHFETNFSSFQNK